jgi:hypothetical protein
MGQNQTPFSKKKKKNQTYPLIFEFEIKSP